MLALQTLDCLSKGPEQTCTQLFFFHDGIGNTFSNPLKLKKVPKIQSKTKMILHQNKTKKLHKKTRLKSS